MVAMSPESRIGATPKAASGPVRGSTKPTLIARPSSTPALVVVVSHDLQLFGDRPVRRIRLERGKVRLAGRVVDDVVPLRGVEEAARRVDGDALRLLDEYEDALGTTIEHMTLRAEAYARLGEDDAAAADWQAVLVLNPQCAPARRRLEKPDTSP